MSTHLPIDHIPGNGGSKGDFGNPTQEYYQMATIISLEKFQEELSSYIGLIVPHPLNIAHAFYLELSSVALGGKVMSVSDEFFAKAVNLIEVEVREVSQGELSIMSIISPLQA